MFNDATPREEKKYLNWQHFNAHKKIAENILQERCHHNDYEDELQKLHLRFVVKSGDLPRGKGYYAKSALNQSREYRSKSARRRKNFPTISIKSDFIKDGHESPEDSLSRKETEALIKRCIAELPLIYQKIIVLYHYQEKTLVECSKHLRMNYTTVKMYYKRSKKILREKLLKYEDFKQE